MRSRIKRLIIQRFDHVLAIIKIANGIVNMDERRRIEDKFICKLQTLKGSGINCDLGAYAKEMYASYAACLENRRH